MKTILGRSAAVVRELRKMKGISIRQPRRMVDWWFMLFVGWGVKCISACRLSIQLRRLGTQLVFETLAFCLSNDCVIMPVGWFSVSGAIAVSRYSSGLRVVSIATISLPKMERSRTVCHRPHAPHSETGVIRLWEACKWPRRPVAGCAKSACEHGCVSLACLGNTRILGR